MNIEPFEKVHKVNHPFKSLKHPNFRYYWLGMCISLIGTWMQNIAQPCLAYDLTHSPFLLSLIGALQFTPILLFSLVAGFYVDRFPKKKILFITQTAFVIELVGKDDLMNAIAMNSMAFNVARVIGPSIAGLIMGYFGVASTIFLKPQYW